MHDSINIIMWLRVVHDNYSILWHFIKNHSATSLLGKPQRTQIFWGEHAPPPRTVYSTRCYRWLVPPQNKKSCMKPCIYLNIDIIYCLSSLFPQPSERPWWDCQVTAPSWPMLATWSNTLYCDVTSLLQPLLTRWAWLYGYGRNIVY